MQHSHSPTHTGNKCSEDDFDNAYWPATDTESEAPGTCAPGYTGSPLRACLITGEWSNTITSPCARACQHNARAHLA